MCFCDGDFHTCGFFKGPRRAWLVFGDVPPSKVYFVPNRRMPTGCLGWACSFDDANRVATFRQTEGFIGGRRQMGGIGEDGGHVIYPNALAYEFLHDGFGKPWSLVSDE